MRRPAFISAWKSKELILLGQVIWLGDDLKFTRHFAFNTQCTMSQLASVTHLSCIVSLLRRLLSRVPDLFPMRHCTHTGHRKTVLRLRTTAGLEITITWDGTYRVKLWISRMPRYPLTSAAQVTPQHRGNLLVCQEELFCFVFPIVIAALNKWVTSISSCGD